MADERKNFSLDIKLSVPMLFAMLSILSLICLYFCGIRYETSLNAFVEGGHSVEIASRVAGQVSSVKVENKKNVKANSVLIELKKDAYQKDLNDSVVKLDDLSRKLAVAEKKVSEISPSFESASKSLNSLKSKLSVVEENYTKSVEMYKEGILTKEDYDNNLADLTSLQEKVVTAQTVYDEVNSKYMAAISDVKALEAEFKTVEQQKLQARYNLSNTNIYAPEDGVVSELNVKVGDFVKPTQVVMNINPQKLWVVANYKATKFDDIENGQLVWVKLDSLPNEKFKGHIDNVVPYENENNVDMVTLKVLFDEDVSNAKIKPGQSVVLKLRERIQ